MAMLSVVMPVYNEEGTIEQIVARVLAVRLPGEMATELVLIDDGSGDGSWQRMQAAAAAYPDRLIRIIRQDRNRGKGAAVRAGIGAAGGDFLLIQDADLEYDPADYPRLLAPLLAGQADVVYGSRFRGRGNRDRLIHRLGNRMLTLLSNAMTGLRLTDMETCYKAFTRQAIRSITIRSDRFEVEPELTAKIARGGWRVGEVPISYAGRGYAEGKKITWRDGAKAIWTIVRYRFWE